MSSERLEEIEISSKKFEQKFEQTGLSSKGFKETDEFKEI